MMDVQNGTTTCEEGGNMCHKLKCECAEHTLGKIVNFLSENRGSETEVAICENEVGLGSSRNWQEVDGCMSS